jgi:hypothetical protein
MPLHAHQKDRSLIDLILNGKQIKDWTEDDLLALLDNMDYKETL